MPQPALIYKAAYAATGVNTENFQTDRWIVRSQYGVILGEIYDRNFMLQVKELLGIKEAVPSGMDNLHNSLGSTPTRARPTTPISAGRSRRRGG